MESHRLEEVLPLLLTVSVSPAVSVESSVSDVDDIRPLLSPIVSDPDDLETDPTAADRMMLTPGEDDDDFLLRSLKSASFLKSRQSIISANSNPNYKNNTSSRVSLKRYKDIPKSSGSDEAQPFIFHPNNSKLLNSYISINNDENNGGNPGTRRRRSSLTDSIVSEVIYLKELTLSQLKRRRFLIVCLFSMICMFIFNLIFLPRTTLNRDLRRLYGGFLTSDDVSRMFISQLNYNSNMDELFKFYQLENYKPGSKNYKNIEMMLRRFDYLHTNTEYYDVYMGEPVDINLKLLDQSNFVIYEPELKEPETGMFSYIPYSTNGKISNSQFIFVNYGLASDYKLLKNVDLEDKVFIIRKSPLHHSSVVAKLAQESGANSIIFFSDPCDDNKFTELNNYKPFPGGPSRNHDAIDLETSNFIYEQPGDPTTPGWSPALFDSFQRIKDPKTVPKVPIVSLSYKQVEPILSKLNNMGENFDWTGNLNDFDYSVGPNEKFQISINNNIKYEFKPIYNIITTVEGIISDEEIILGSSRDSITGFGGMSKSTVSLIEIARGFNELAKKGWKPLRTIKLISWDATSLGMIGSVEHGEYYGQNLINNCILYINLDDVRGRQLHIESNPLFDKLIKNVMELILVNEADTLYDEFKRNDQLIGMISNEVKDYTIFQNHLGIPSINIGFKENGKIDPVSYYNSKYDDFELLKMFDPNLKIHNLLSQFIGMLIIQFSEYEILEISTNHYLKIINNEFIELSRNIPESWKYENMSYPFEFKTVNEELVKLDEIFKTVSNLSTKFDDKLKDLQFEILQDYPWFKLYKKIKLAINIKLLNMKIKSLDKLFLSSTKESWFRHIIFSPNPNDKSTIILPGLNKSIRDGDFEEFGSSLISLHIALQDIIHVLG